MAASQEPGPGDTVRATVVDAARVRLRQHVAGPTPRPGDGWMAELLWGFAQPLLGIRLILRDSDLRNVVTVPVLGLALVCVLAGALAEGRTAGERLGVAYATLLALAPVPSVLFGRHYARLAARVHTTLNLGPADPHFKPILRHAWESLLQVVAIGAGVAPMVGIMREMPYLGVVWGFVLGSLWALHWIVVEALDSARILRPGERAQDVEAEANALPEAWFVRIYRWPRLPWVLRAPAGWFGSMVDRVSRGWRAEVLLMERNPVVTLGFGLSTAVLLGVPVLNLLFRPAVVVGGTHLRARLSE